MRFDPIASKSPVKKIPPVMISVYLCKHYCTGKIVKNIRYYLSFLLSGWSLVGNPHWRKKTETGGKKQHERLRDTFKITKKRVTENLSTSLNLSMTSALASASPSSASVTFSKGILIYVQIFLPYTYI